jgi:isoleucyl-tRNA synthetase
MWVCASDYADDLRIGPEILKTTIETYRKLRNTIRWMLGSLAHFQREDRVAPEKMPELERLMLHRLAELDELVRKAYADFDYKRIFAALSHFMTTDLSAFYFDVRKDALYCDPISSRRARPRSPSIDQLFRCTVIWLAPMLCFTAEEAVVRALSARRASVHLELFPRVPAAWRDDKLAEKWRKVRLVRRVVTGALEIERAGKRIGSSLEADPIVHVSNPSCSRRWSMSIWPRSASRRRRRWSRRRPGRRLPAAGGAGRRGRGEPRRRPQVRALLENLARVGSDPQYPDVTPRDAQALREWETMRKAAE